MYCGYMGVELPENWNFYLAFAFFRLAVVLQGRHRGSVAGEEPNQGTAMGTELPPCSSTAWSCSFCGVFPFLGELCRGQSWEPGAVSYRWSSQTFQLSTSLCQGIHWEVVRTRCCLLTAGVAWEPLSELNLTLFSHPLERSFPESCWADPEEGM